MKKEIITIDEYGVLTIPNNPTETVWMNDCELVELFGVNFPTLRTHIKSILKSGVVRADFRHGATQYGSYLLPDYYGLEMIMALAFHIQSKEAGSIRAYIANKLCAVNTQSIPTILIQVNTDKRLNRENEIFN